MRILLPLALCGCALDWTPPDKVEGGAAVDDVVPEGSESTDGQVELEAPDDVTETEDDAEGDAGELPPCSAEGCSTICGWAGFGLGVCRASGLDCDCTQPMSCDGPFVGHGVAGRWTVYTIHVADGSVCTVSTCDGFSGDTRIVISGGWNGENDDACGLGSEVTTATIPISNPLSVAIECLSAACSWSITVDCTPACIAEGQP